MVAMLSVSLDLRCCPSANRANRQWLAGVHWHIDARTSKGRVCSTTGKDRISTGRSRRTVGSNVKYNVVMEEGKGFSSQLSTWMALGSRVHPLGEYADLDSGNVLAQTGTGIGRSSN